jgi:hypothetical protein
VLRLASAVLAEIDDDWLAPIAATSLGKTGMPDRHYRKFPDIGLRNILFFRTM